MKVEFNSQQLRPSRGSVPKVGNVYSHMRARYYKVVIGIGDPGKRWNCVHMIHVDATGDVVGTSSQPIPYCQNHQDLVGFVEKMPTLKVGFVKT